MASLVVFGGTDPISGVVVLCSAFDMGSSKEQNCAVWEKCGAAPLICACLQNNSQVRREISDDDDAANTAMTRIQEANNVSTHFLSRNGFDGNVFKDNVKKVGRKSVTVRHSMERIEKIQQATTHNNLFHGTGGGHLTDYDIFWLHKRRLSKQKQKSCKRGKSLQERCLMLR